MCPLPIGGMNTAIITAVAIPNRASSQSDSRQDMKISSSDVSAGIAAFPKSPVKL